MHTGRFSVSFPILILFGVFLETQAFAQNPPGKSPDGTECASIEDASKRLECYDGIAGGISAPAETPESYFSKVWELDENTRRDKYTFRIHRSTYVLPLTYNNTPNVDAVREANPEKDLKKPEVVFQMSFKIKLLEGLLGRKVDLWFGYTQRSFWQLYNFADSSPFRETNYEPELLLNFKTNFDVLGLKCRYINFGFNHQSNGQSEPLSRSWNRMVANFGFERKPLYLLLKTWYRFPEDAETDDNPDINNYLGNGEIRAYYFYKKQRFELMFRNSLRSQNNHSAVEAAWSFPFFFKNVDGYVQYFNGYGESMLDYNHHTNRIGIGVIVIDWE
jgi:phospholipase A1